MNLKIFLPITIILSIIFGFFIGRITHIVYTAVPPTVIRNDVRPSVPFISITGLHDGNVIGTLHGNARFFLGDTMAIPDGSGSFRIPAGNILRETVAIRIPAGMKFVASKRGKKFYPVKSPNAAKLAPANRVYFSDAASAQRAGYSAGD